MPSPVFALNGPDFGAAADQKVAVLQNTLVILGTGIGDNILKVIVVDGLMGPKTTAAVHVGSGQAAASLRTGSLTQAQILAQLSGITNTLSNEASRRGFKLTTAKVVSTAAKASTSRTDSVSIPSTPMVYTPAPAPGQVYVPPASNGLDAQAIIKWSAIGLGVVVAAGAAYYFMKRRSPSMAGGRSYDSDTRIYRVNYRTSASNEDQWARIVSPKLTRKQLAQKIEDFYEHPNVKIIKVESQNVDRDNDR
jgi:hypothetical protein